MKGNPIQLQFGKLKKENQHLKDQINGCKGKLKICFIKNIHYNHHNFKIKQIFFLKMIFLFFNYSYFHFRSKFCTRM